ncbi:hypothetical protein DFJ73DRAFT_807399 [Zopfochytrium polystomum]|nr:hypothetical protein DFJ73DRAFT_807399 [Zopfochytrium polystomum]
MALKEEIIQWNDGCTAFEGKDYRGALNILEPIADSARIHFDMAQAFSNLSMVEESIGSLTRAVACDQYLAVGYFQRGVLFYKQDLIAEALADFTDALAYLRGNLLIDYTQLGLAYKLYAAEVSFNRGLCFMTVGQTDAGMADFDDASRTKPLDGGNGDYGRIAEALDLGPRAAQYCRPFEVPNKVIFKPPAAKLKNTKKVDYLGRGRVVATADESDTFAGFSGSRLKKQDTTRGEKKTQGPLDDNTFAVPATATLRKKTVKGPGEGQYGPATLGRNAGLPDARTATITRMQTVDRMGTITRAGNAGGKGGPNATLPANFKSRGSSIGGGGGGGGSGGYGGRAVNEPEEDDDRGYGRNRSARDYYEDEGRRSGDRGDRGGRGDSQPRPPPRGASRGREESDGDRGRGTSAGPRTSSRSRDRRYDDDGPGLQRRGSTANSMMTSTTSAGEKFKIKCHYNDTRIILVPVDVTFDDLSSRIQKKFNSKVPLKLKYRDSDNEMVLMTDQEDLEIAFEMNGLEYGVPGGQTDRFEIWCSL